MIKTVIIEDEEPAALRLLTLLQKLEPEISVVSVIDTVESAVKWFKNNPDPDLILLDIQLGDGLSFDIFSKVNIDSYIIFTTAYDEYAVKAFELNSIDYLLKPVNEERLSNSLNKFRKYKGSHNANINQLLEAMEKRDYRYKRRFVVTIAGKIKVIETVDIASFYSKEKNSFLCTTEKRHYPVDFSLDQIETMLNPDLFFRVNRQYIVQYKSIDRIDIMSKSRIKITTIPPSDEEILISTARTSEFRIWLER
jgi:two-component system, LytTR family, response regulator LytT